MGATWEDDVGVVGVARGDDMEVVGATRGDDVGTVEVARRDDMEVVGGNLIPRTLAVRIAQPGWPRANGLTVDESDWLTFS